MPFRSAHEFKFNIYIFYWGYFEPLTCPVLWGPWTLYIKFSFFIPKNDSLQVHTNKYLNFAQKISRSMTHFFFIIWNLWFTPIEFFSSHSTNFVTKDGDVNVGVQKLIIWHHWILKIGVVMWIDISWNSFCSFASLSLVIKDHISFVL